MLCSQCYMRRVCQCWTVCDMRVTFAACSGGLSSTACVHRFCCESKWTHFIVFKHSPMFIPANTLSDERSWNTAALIHRVCMCVWESDVDIMKSTASIFSLINSQIATDIFLRIDAAVSWAPFSHSNTNKTKSSTSLRWNHCAVFTGIRTDHCLSEKTCCSNWQKNTSQH